MTTVAVIAHRDKRMGSATPSDLRNALTTAGVTEPLWFEVPKSKKAPKAVKRALDQGADLVFAWGGDGMVQRCADALVGTGAELAIVPAGTANLLATNLGIPKELDEAIATGLHGRSRTIDLGRMNGEHFAVMAGAGFDAHLIAGADKETKERLGRLAYVWTGARALRHGTVPLTVDVDGARWFKGDASCVLLGNVPTITGGFTAFDDASPDDGHLAVAVVTASSGVEWMRVLTRLATGRSDRTPLVHVTKAEKVDVRMKEAMPYELDGGDRGTTKRLRVKAKPGALTVRVPDAAVAA
jgi:YegS/Rv2252/BmrU family lipid kinase